MSPYHAGPMAFRCRESQQPDSNHNVYDRSGHDRLNTALFFRPHRGMRFIVTSNDLQEPCAWMI